MNKRNDLNFDEFISKEAKKLTRHPVPDDLWFSIQAKLEQVKSRIPLGRRIRDFMQSQWREPALKYATVAVSVVLIIVMIWRNFIYESDPLAEVAKMEKRYVEAIERLEEKITQQEPVMDIGLWALYQERLMLLDESIADCKKTIEQNNENINAHKYLRLAYQEKVNTLKKLIERQKG
jgi:tetratricopeptide (TPR) repeat protein